MSERLTISVDASETGPNLMKVQDVFAHVLELFNLAAKSESDPENTVVWCLVSVSMNSPMTVTAEAVAARPGVNVDAIARAQKMEFATNINSLRRGIIPRVWSGDSTKKVAKDLLYRNRNGIGKTNINFNVSGASVSQVEITHEDAEAAVKILARTSNELIGAPTKSQVGSIEGYLVDVSNYYNKPAILVKERKTGAEIWCVVNDAFRREIAGTANFDDVWSKRRIVVSGLITYDKERKIARVEASHVRTIKDNSVSVSDITDSEFTDGLSARKYLEKFREGSFD